MSNTAETVIKPAFTPVRLHERPLVWQLGALIIGVLFLTLSSYIEVPMFPVPITMQTFAVTLTGALMGWLAERGWNGNRMRLAFTGMLISNGLCFLLGAAWLSVIIGAEKALILGVLPFLIGGLLKSVLGAVILRLLARGKNT